MSDAGIIVILILFHFGSSAASSIITICKHLKHLFPQQAPYNRFVELEKKVLPPLTIFIKKVLLGTYTNISFIGTSPLRVYRNDRILIHKTSEGLVKRENIL